METLLGILLAVGKLVLVLVGGSTVHRFLIPSFRFLIILVASVLMAMHFHSLDEPVKFTNWEAHTPHDIVLWYGGCTILLAMLLCRMKENEFEDSARAWYWGGNFAAVLAIGLVVDISRLHPDWAIVGAGIAVYLAHSWLKDAWKTYTLKWAHVVHALTIGMRRNH